MPSQKIQLVVFDWAGTTVDHGCFAPVAAFIEAFRSNGVEATVAEARAPMGLHKMDHIRTMFQMERIAAQWKEVKGQDWTENDVKSIYETFMPFQMKMVEQYTDLVPGALDCFDWLKQKGIHIGSTTGYPRVVADVVIPVAAKNGYNPEVVLCADEVSQGRPAPWMIYRNMEALNIFPPKAVVKVGDTIPDIHAGLNAGVHTVGVTQTSSEVGLTVDEFNALSAEEQTACLQKAENVLRGAGAEHIIQSIADLPALIESL